MITRLLQLNFVFFLPGYIFLQFYSKLFVFTPSKRTQNSLRPPGILQMFSLYLYLYLQLFTHFTLPHFHLLAYIYLHLLVYICVLFMLLYELDKIGKVWRIQKQRRNFLDRRVFLVLKIIIQTQPPEVFYKKSCSSKFGNIHRKITVLEPLNKVADSQPYKFTEKGLQHRCFPVYIANFLRTSILKNIQERLPLINRLLQ